MVKVKLAAWAIAGLFIIGATGSGAAEPPAAAGWTAPEGFVVERVAGPPLIEHPMFACFDERGRLFVAEAAGQNLKADELLAAPPNLIRLLEDSDGDGRFDKSGVFADKMTFPMGVLWHAGALYTASPPSLWRLEDVDGDGVAEKRTELVTKFGFTGNAADIHGPFLAPDGRLYWTDGRHGHEILGPDGQVMKGLAARIFRAARDGKNVEVVCGGGMDDPVEICFTPEGEALATVDILISRPSRIDAIIHCVYGGVFPHYAPVLGEFKRTGELLPAAADLGWVAPAGLMRYRGTALGADYQGNLFTAQFNTHKIQRHILARQGATFAATSEDFLVFGNHDSHPTDVLEDADGSLLVVDTGGWFVRGCPTSQIAKPDITGGIYRVRRRDAPREPDARGLRLNWDQLGAGELAGLLDDARFAARDRAIHQLAEFGERALPALSKVVGAGPTARARRNAVWAATRMDAPAARALVRGALDDRDAGVRTAAAHSIALHRDSAAEGQLARLVKADETPAVRREAATALGRLRSRSAVPVLLDALASGGDRFLEHSLIYALLEIADRDAALAGLSHANPAARRGALIALDQMNGGDPPREAVVRLLADDDLALRQTAWSIVLARPDWSREVVAQMKVWLCQENLSASQAALLRGALTALYRDGAVQELIGESLRDPRGSHETRLLLLETLTEMPLEALPAAWTAALVEALGDGDDRVVRQAISLVRGHPSSAAADALLRVANSPRPAEVRVVALGALTRGAVAATPAFFELLRARLSGESPALERVAAAEALANLRLDDRQREELTSQIALSGPLEMAGLLSVYENDTNSRIGAKLVAALAQAPGFDNVSPTALRAALAHYPSEIQQAAAPLLRRLDGDAESRAAKIAELIETLQPGESKRGRGVFFSAKAACSACHSVGADGGHVGPDLTKIGGIRSRRDLLEAIVFPSSSIVRGYEPYVITTDDGRTHAGLMLRENADTLQLVAADRRVVVIARSSIEAIERGRVSIMPQGLDAQLPPSDLADLLAFLESLR